MPAFLALVCIYYLPEVEYWGGSYDSNQIYVLICLALSLLGQGIRLYAVGTTPANTSGRNTKTQIAETLNQTGMYSVVRHPLYLANFLMYLGVVLLVKNWIVLVIFVLFFALYYERIMFAEEMFLRKKFGDAFLQWAETTPAFFPDFRKFQPPGLPFSFRTGLRREYQGIFGLITVYVLFDGAILYFNETGRFQESFWGGFRLQQWVVLCGTIVLYSIVRFLHKATRLLEVEGRW